MFPFFFLLHPQINKLLTHSTPTGYTRQGSWQWGCADARLFGGHDTPSILLVLRTRHIETSQANPETQTSVLGPDVWSMHDVTWVNSPCAGIFNEICEKKTPVPVPVFLHVLGGTWRSGSELAPISSLEQIREASKLQEFIYLWFILITLWLHYDCSRRFPSFSSLQWAPTPPLTFTWEQESLNEALPPLQELNELSPVSFTPQRGERWTMMNVRSWLEKFNEYQWIGFNLNLCSSTAYTPPKNAGEWRKMLSLRNTSWRQEHCILHSQILHLLLETADEGHWFCRSCRGAELDLDW